MKTIDFRYLVCSPDLNAHGTLHGGTLLRWIDEATGMHARKLTNRVCVTRFIDGINFVSKAKSGDIMLVTTTLENIGATSISFSVDVREDISKRSVATVDKIVFVSIDHQGNTVKHGVKNELDKKIIRD